jgi:PKD repeat protein
VRALLAFLPLLVLAGCPDADPAPDEPDPPFADAGPDLVGPVSQTLVFDGSNSSDATSWTWNFGNGETAVGEQVSYAFPDPGHYVAVLTVGDRVGRTSTDALVVTVHEPVSAETITNASPLVGDGETLWVAMADFDLVAVVDRATAALSGHLEVCDQPRNLALRDGVLYVACAGDDRVELWDAATSTRSESFALPAASAPYAALPAGGSSVLVTLRNRSDVAVIDTTDGTVTFIDALPDQRTAAARGDDVFSVRFRSPDEGGEMINLEAGATIDLPLDPGPDSDTGARGVPTYLMQVALSPSGSTAAVVGLQANIERGVWREGVALTHETTARATLRLVDPDSNEQVARRTFDDRDMGSAVTWSPLGDWLYVATHGMETVEVLDPWTFELTGAFLNVGRGPQGLVADDALLWVYCALSRELVGFALRDLGAPQEEFARISLVPASGEVLEADVLLGNQIFHRSADVRMTKDGYVSCGSCHFEGGGDNRTWDFTDRGEGLRNTPSLLGRGGAVPIHWTGNFDEVQDFENDVRGPQQGAGFLSDEDWKLTSDTLGEPKAGRSPDLDALAAYVESLSDPRPSPFGAPDPGSAGGLLFNDPVVGCADCHPFPAYTDSQFLAPGQPLLHDVGTLTEASGQRLGEELFGIDTPQLLGLWATPPYLHDGSAETLLDVLVTKNPNDEHGTTSHLSAEQLGELEGFLLTL